MEIYTRRHLTLPEDPTSTLSGLGWKSGISVRNNKIRKPTRGLKDLICYASYTVITIIIGIYFLRFHVYQYIREKNYKISKSFDSIEIPWNNKYYMKRPAESMYIMNIIFQVVEQPLYKMVVKSGNIYSPTVDKRKIYSRIVLW